MSDITFVRQATTPITPSVGYVTAFIGNDGLFKTVDETGTVASYTVTSEDVQDIVGALLQDSSSIDVTYNDVGNAITFAVLPAGVDHNSLLNFVANKHIDHSTVSITAGSGLSGGGDLTTTRTISMPAVGTAGTYGSALQVPVITTDAQGRVSAVTLTDVSKGGYTDAVNSATLSTTSNTTLTNITALAFSVVNGSKYKIEVQIAFQSANTNTGIALSINTTDTAAGNIYGTTMASAGNNGTDQQYEGDITALGDIITANAASAANTNLLATITAVFVATASGTLVPQFRSKTNGTAITVYPGSNLTLKTWT